MWITTIVLNGVTYDVYGTIVVPGADMARIPEAVSILQGLQTRREQPNQQGVRDLQNILIAAILRAEDDCLTITDEELRRARDFTLVVTAIPDEDAAVLTVRAR